MQDKMVTQARTVCQVALFVGLMYTLAADRSYVMMGRPKYSQHGLEGHRDASRFVSAFVRDFSIVYHIYVQALK